MPIALTDEVRDVLSRSTITPSSLQLPPGQLPRSLYEAVNKVIEAAGGKWDRKRRLHVFDVDPREKLGLAQQSGQIVSRKQELQVFYTPDELADRVAHKARVKRGSLVLEPSAGQGALAQACVRAGVLPADITCVEIDDEAFGHLKGFRLLQQDFLQLTDPALVCTFDAVVMNPPFTRGKDVAHVHHAMRFPCIGGRLVAIMAPSWRTATTLAARTFREQLAQDYEFTVENLPAGSFESAGTSVATVMLVATRKR